MHTLTTGQDNANLWCYLRVGAIAIGTAAAMSIVLLFALGLLDSVVQLMAARPVS